MLQTRALMDYVLPGAGDLPADFRITHMETPTRFNPFGMRGAGEGGCIGAHAAVANAVADALRDYDVAVEGRGRSRRPGFWRSLDKPRAQPRAPLSSIDAH